MLASVMFHAKHVAWLATEDDGKHCRVKFIEYRMPVIRSVSDARYGLYGTAMLVLSLGFLIGNFLRRATLLASVERRPAGRTSAPATSVILNCQPPTPNSQTLFRVVVGSWALGVDCSL